jgi:hypothetical protein
MIYRGPGFLAVAWFGPPPTSYPPPSPVSKLDRRHPGRLKKRDNSLTTEGRGGERVAESYDRRRKKSLILYKSFNTHCVSTLIVHSWRYKGFPSAQQKQHIHVEDIIDALRRRKREEEKELKIRRFPVFVWADGSWRGVVVGGDGKRHF